MTTELTAWDDETDVLILGGGVAGLSSGVFARKRNLDVLICEKMPVIGGTTATSAGIAWIPGTAKALAADANDSIENAREYLKGELGPHYRADLVDAFLSAGAEAVATLEENTEVLLDYVKWPDYHADKVGGVAAGRVLEARRFDGRKLGKDFELIRPPIARLMVLGGLSLDRTSLDAFLHPFKSFSSFRRVLSTVARHGLDKLSYSRGTDIGGGNALVARLLCSLRKLGAELWTDTPLIELVAKRGEVLGAIVNRNGRARRVRARCGVILATGGFPHNAQMRRELGPDHPHDLSVGWHANVGEGIDAARRVGAAIDRDVAGPGLWQPSSLLKHADGTEETILYGYLDRGKPGVIAVDTSGRRFVNESNSYHDIGEAMFRNGIAGGNRFYFVCDRAFVWKRGLDLIRPYVKRLERYERQGYITLAGSVDELARKIGVDAGNLRDTIRRNNEYAETGIDPEFGRGTTPLNTILMGDPNHEPNPCLGPMDPSQLVALRMYPSTLGTCIGLAVDSEARVLDSAGRVIDGLYACGQDVSSVMRGYYPGPGINIGPAIVFAYIATRHVARHRNTRDKYPAAEELRPGIKEANGGAVDDQGRLLSR